ncbi:hypothetical protein C8Q73DRAFT_793122 [Cubamyces lactineus]|nr:hypothetical protein C8Q73DRAFT_793122 [Cubamyces lactineus]
MQPTPVSAFPTEIYEQIVQEIGPNRIVLPLMEDGVLDRRTRLSTLCACALTCRAWLPTSRTYLYRQLTFIGTEKAALELLVRSLEANPWLRTLVYDLNVIDNDAEYTPGMVTDQTLSIPEPTRDISRTWALILAGKLPYVRDIGLALARGLTCHPQFVRSLHTFTAVASLSLAWKGSGTFQDLLKLLTAFSGLRRLLVYGASWAPRGARKLVLPRRRFPQLVVLTIETDGESKPGLWQRVSYGIIQAAGPTLKVLFLEETSIPYEPPADTDEMQLVQPGRLSSLETLHIQVLRAMEWPHPDYERLVAWASQSSGSLKHLLLYYSAFGMDASLEDVKQFLDRLKPLAVALHQSPLRALPKLTLIVTQYFEDDGNELHSLVADATLYARTVVFRVCKATEIQIIWGVMEQSSMMRMFLYQTVDGLVRTCYEPPPDLAHSPLSWDGHSV